MDRKTFDNYIRRFNAEDATGEVIEMGLPH